VIEDVASGLFRTQVLDLSRSIARHSHELSIRIVAVNRPWKIIGHWIALKKYRKLLAGSSIRITYIPILPPLRNAVGNPLFSEFLIAILRTCTFFLNLIGRVDVWHARGYWTAIALHRNGWKNLLFDPRSLWVLENQSAGNIAPESNSLRYWLANEGAVVDAANYVTVVSRGMKEYYCVKYPNANVSVIPISASEHFFTFNFYVRQKYRHQLGWQDKMIFVYSGSLGLSGINLNALAKMFYYVLSQENARLLILSDGDKETLLNMMKMIDVDLSKFIIIRPESSEISCFLAAADIGLHALPKQLDSFTRLGTKVVEYWATGLPALGNKYVGAACDYIEENRCLGRVVNFDNQLPHIGSLVKEMMQSSREEIKLFSKSTFSSNVVAERYYQVYHSISFKNAPSKNKNS
jgi:glycosyltransferase involved in cell wall biosynthesis